MRARNKVALLTLAVVSLAVAGLVTVEAATNTPAFLHNCSGAMLAEYMFNVTDIPDPVNAGEPLTYTVNISSTPPGANQSGYIALWFGRDWSMNNISASGSGWSCSVYATGTECISGFIWDGMSLTAGADTMVNATGVLSTLVSPYGDACAGSTPGYANTDTIPVPVELQHFVVD